MNTSLVIFLSMNWGPTERYALSDLVRLKNKGIKVLFFCLRDSYLHRRATAYGIDCIFPRGNRAREGMNIFQWGTFTGFNKILDEQSISWVHFYQFFLFSKLSHSLRKKNNICLFYSWIEDKHQSLVGRSTRRLYQKLFLRRLDAIFVQTKNNEERCAKFFNYPVRKVHGVSSPYLNKSMNELSNTPNQDQEGEYLGGERVSEKDFAICLYFDQNIEEFEHVKPLLKGLSKSLQESAKQDLRVVFCSDFKWSERVLFEPVQHFLQEIQFPLDKLSFYQGHCDEDFLQKMTIYIETSPEKTSYCEKTFIALRLGLGLLLKRDSFSLELLSTSSRQGETYAQSDAHNARQKILSLVSSIESYKKGSKLTKKKLEELFNVDKDIEFYYELIHRARERLNHSHKQ